MTSGPWLIEPETQAELERWLSSNTPRDVPPIVMLLRGDSQHTRELLPDALDAAKLSSRRVVVWITDDSFLASERVAALLPNDPEVIAVTLDLDQRPRGWVYAGHIDVPTADHAFQQAEEASELDSSEGT
jgi:hypothetical protein